MSRPAKINPELIQRICGHIERGNSTRMSAAAEGISESTIHRWQQRGRNLADEKPSILKGDDVLYRELWEGIARARGQAVTKLKAVMLRAAVDRQDWRAAEALGKSMYPDEFRTERIEVSGPEGGPIEFEPDLEKLEDVIKRTVDGADSAAD